ncbi:MAG: HlyC/CorC family transporter [Muribaculaceae bacterium]|jgi:CBS domain containing-hemolysin-like protein|nr:HlyC/CorC family transporter [Muribaculaceae bacterium]MBQ2399098.1 HlyC/CorC family transporter [Muribaculaceae bacterium]MBQ2440536.1 HlyC/CorC family transporter [Muribaculaceae bacterium]MBQ5724167.1 HlyC/CorC family transporter [Muribaculaceae bacterium]MBR5788143.1 HlyC/CorC family transporter [Muribaculaceae bacterium]
MTITLAFILTIIAIILSGLFSGTEIAFIQSNKVRIEIDASKGGIINKIISRFNANQDMFISTLLVGNNITLVIYGITISVILNPMLQQVYDNEAFMLIANTLISTGIILITGEFMPKTVFRINPNVMLKVFALPVFLIYIVLYPISKFSSWISTMMMRLFGVKNEQQESGAITMDELDDYIQQTIEDQKDKEEIENEVKIFRKAIDFKDTHISDCMIPRNEIVAVDVETTTKEQLIDTFVTTGLSKIVVYSDDIDNVCGYIHVAELLDAEVVWKERIKPVLYTPESMLANKMMRRLMAEKKSMAIVVDEFGGTCGLVTLEDLVEEIFGEIEDEHDFEKQVGTRLSDTSFEFSGRAEIEHINEEFDLDLKESESYHTLAGYLLDNLESLPTQGDVYEISGLKFTIIKMSATRIETIRVDILPDNKE